MKIFECIMKNPHRTGNLFVDYSEFIYNPDMIYITYMDNANCKILNNKDYYKYFVGTICYWECLSQNNLFYCDVEKNKRCTEQNSDSDYVQCQFNLTPFIRNIRYSRQVNCLLAKYRNFKASRIVNAVKLFFNRFSILKLV